MYALVCLTKDLCRPQRCLYCNQQALLYHISVVFAPLAMFGMPNDSYTSLVCEQHTSNAAFTGCLDFALHRGKHGGPHLSLGLCCVQWIRCCIMPFHAGASLCRGKCLLGCTSSSFGNLSFAEDKNELGIT